MSSVETLKSQLRAFKAQYKNINNWLAECTLDEQLKVMRTIAEKSDIVMTTYPELCQYIRSCSRMSGGIFDKAENPLTLVKDEIELMFHGEMPKEIEEIYNRFETEEDSDNDLGEIAAERDLGNLAAEPQEDPNGIVFEMVIGNNTFRVCESSEETFVAKVATKVLELKAMGLENEIPEQFRGFSDRYIPEAARALFRNAQAKKRASEAGIDNVTRMYAAKSSTKGFSK